MSASVLGHLTLGYQLVWNRLRQPVAVQLFIDQPDAVAVDAAHLLATLAQAWSAQSPTLVLCVRSGKLLLELLQHAAPDGPWIAVQDTHLADPLVAAQVHAAHQRGLQLLWRGEPAQEVDAATADCFALVVITLDGGETLPAWAAAPPKHPPDGPARNGGAPAGPMPSPLFAGRIFEAVASHVMAQHCLDQHGAWGLAGWPVADVLSGYRNQPVEPAVHNITRLLQVTDADAPLEVIEHTLAEEPVLVYRFLLYANSAALRRRTEVTSLRHGLMLMGLSTFRRWLVEQLPKASSDLNLQPVRGAIVVRARLTEQLLDAGDDDELRSEVYLCGVLSQIGLLLGQPLATAVERLALSERATSTVVDQSGPYMPYLEIATALEYPRMDTVPALCASHQIDIGEVNRALLRVLAQAYPHPARGRRVT